MAIASACTLQRFALLGFASVTYSLWYGRQTNTTSQTLTRVILGRQTSHCSCPTPADILTVLASIYCIDIPSLILVSLGGKRNVPPSKFASHHLESDFPWSSLLILLGSVLGIGFHCLFYTIFKSWTSTDPRTNTAPSSEQIALNIPTNTPRTPAELPARQDLRREQANAPETVRRGLDRTWNPAQGINLAQRSPEANQEFSPVAMANASRRRAVQRAFKKAQSEPASNRLHDFSAPSSGLLTPSPTP